MSTNWKAYTEQLQAKQYVLPDGWDSREKIATDLDCSEDGVRRVLSPALKSGAVECKQFPIWDKVTKRVKSVTAYRKVEVLRSKPKCSSAK